MHIVFWQNSPSIHQAPFIKALAALCQDQGITVTVVSEGGVSEKRMSMGWNLPDFGAAEVIIKPAAEERREILEGNSGRDCYHIFSGFDMTPLNKRTLKAALTLPCKVGVYLERPKSYPLAMAALRKLKYCLYARIFRDIDFLFPIGSMAAHYYAECGFDRRKIYPFAYFVADTQNSMPEGPNHSVQFVYVGSDIHLKGVDLIVLALEGLPGHEGIFRFVGVSEDAFEKYNVSESLKPKIRFLGPMPNDEAQKVIAASDVLILPSRYDGWGAVVSEALLGGTRVIVSTEVGAKDLVSDATWRGWVFKAGCAEDLQVKMREALAVGPLNSENRQAIKEWASDTIAPEKGAQYFLQCLKHEPTENKPLASWLPNTHQSCGGGDV